MSEEINNPPAFPLAFETYDREGAVDDSTFGMSLRDYFAGQALQGLLAQGQGMCYSSEWAADAYKVADDMLKERGEK